MCVGVERMENMDCSLQPCKSFAKIALPIMASNGRHPVSQQNVTFHWWHSPFASESYAHVHTGAMRHHANVAARRVTEHDSDRLADGTRNHIARARLLGRHQRARFAAGLSGQMSCEHGKTRTNIRGLETACSANFF